MSNAYKTIMTIPRMEEIVEKHRKKTPFREYDNYDSANSYRYLGAKMVHNGEEYYFASKNLAIFFFTVHGDIQQDEKNEILERFTVGYKKGYNEVEATIADKLGLQERSHSNIQAIVCKMYAELYKKYDDWLYSAIYKFDEVGYNQGQLHKLKVMMQGLDTVTASENIRERPNIPQLHLGLSEKQITVLYNQLMEYKFINKEIDKSNFNWAFGVSNPPQDFHTIEWTAHSKHSFRELLESFRKPITNQMIKNIEILFSYKEKPFVLGKRKNADNSANNQEIDKIVIKVKDTK